MVSELDQLAGAAGFAVIAYILQAEARSGWSTSVAGLAPLMPERRWRVQFRVGVAAAALALLLAPWAPDVAAAPFFVALICLAWRPLEEHRRTLRVLLRAPQPAGPPYRPAIGVGVATAVQVLAGLSLLVSAVLIVA